jgi:hypothetical protein
MTSIIIPLIAFGIGVLCRKLIRGHGWEWKDFYCGAELSIVAVTSALVQIADIGLPHVTRAMSATQPATQPTMVNHQVLMDLWWTGVFALIALFVMLFLMSLHQDHETDKEGKVIAPCRTQIGILGGIGNFCGVFLFFAYLLWIKRAA